MEDEQGRVLLAKRTNEPAKGQWWFLGGRVHFQEMREQAAIRKLKEECGLESDQMIELGTYDVIVSNTQDNCQLHGITTLYHIEIGKKNNYILDAQNSEADWRLPEEWQNSPLHPFIEQGLVAFRKLK
ncbi:MAG: NUDIX domain-containing protein [Candidatus Brocadiales bacterium]|nr:NUDIX domain-containing protein [Candidatus Brocadiales bacterium]